MNGFKNLLDITINAEANQGLFNIHSSQVFQVKKTFWSKKPPAVDVSIAGASRNRRKIGLYLPLFSLSKYLLLASIRDTMLS